MHFARADKLFTRLRAARLDNTLDAEMRRLARVDLLILDLCRDRDYAEEPVSGFQFSCGDGFLVVRPRLRSA